MTAADLLRLVVVRLEEAGLDYAIGGSVASMVYGEPRATLDIDVIVTLDAEAAALLLDLFPAPEFYVSAERVDAVVRSGGSFNVIQPESGLKIDFFVVSDAIEERQIDRRLRRPVLPGLDAWFSPPEELILKKLEYLRAGGAEKHLRDIRSMLAISPEAIDVQLLEELVVRFGLEEAWERIADMG
jgi:hypothetical protein